MRGSQEVGRENRPTGQCPVCGDRMSLDGDGLIPKHKRPERFANGNR
jgi:hypothetical protein